MQDSEFTFSPSEIKLIHNRDFFIQKISVIKKISSQFRELNGLIEQIKIENKNILPADVFAITGKISKGENYSGFPYLVLDNPRVFSNRNIFAFRSMFWWGNYFSFTFHLAGKHLQDYQENILRNFKKLKQKKILIGIHNDQWIHHLENDNYQLVSEFDEAGIEKLIETNKFLKFSRKLELNSWNSLNDFGTETFREFISLIQS